MHVCASAGGERPRIGLALSGGGARGFSHVGVLRALESLRVPVDCIGGTSAGSAVGAAYAVGLVPDEIEQRLRQADWSGSIFSDEPERAERPFRTKNGLAGDPLGVTFGVGAGGLRGTSGILAGQQVELFLHRLLGVSAELPSFDTLPTALRVVTTDLVSGNRVVHRSGSIVHAVKASMAVPSAISPVRIGTQMLVDGGLSENLPVQTLRESCAGIVVAVNISSPLLKVEEIGSLFSVALQVISILMERNVDKSVAALKPGDVLIKPDLGPVSAVDFSWGVDGIQAGEAATLAMADALRPLALPEAAYRQWQAQRLTRRPSHPTVVAVEVAPTRFVDPAVFAAERAAPEQRITKGDPPKLDVDALHRGIMQWTAAGDFTHVG